MDYLQKDVCAFVIYSKKLRSYWRNIFKITVSICSLPTTNKKMLKVNNKGVNVVQM